MDSAIIFLIFLCKNGDSAFKSTTKRTLIRGDDNSDSSNRSSVHHRSQSLSRFSHRLLALGTNGFNEALVTPRGTFVNTVRGSEFPEISLDDLAIEFFESSGDRGRSSWRNSDISLASGSSAPHRRAKLVVRQSSRLTGSD
ncbi:hypothetical protein TorRG33x02_236230 [Trema orientale]|uniref:Uncharacterized protein n=1 Tax=Trema orientale TaxID=63057 RepID=A0A2P5E1B5_TREOI|nr:hypothetical protein TorRG33x02_236230 [Trema orientale]